MRSFIFITTDGTTFQPNSNAGDPDIDNCQVLGYGKGGDRQKAFQNMLKEQDYLLKTTFDEVICLELKNENRSFFYLKNFKKNNFDH